MAVSSVLPAVDDKLVDRSGSIALAVRASVRRLQLSSTFLASMQCGLVQPHRPHAVTRAYVSMLSKKPACIRCTAQNQSPPCWLVRATSPCWLAAQAWYVQCTKSLVFYLQWGLGKRAGLPMCSKQCPDAYIHRSSMMLQQQQVQQVT